GFLLSGAPCASGRECGSLLAPYVHQLRLASRAGEQRAGLRPRRARSAERVGERTETPAGLGHQQSVLRRMRGEARVDVREEHVEQWLPGLVLDQHRPVARGVAGMAHQLLGHGPSVCAGRLKIRQFAPVPIAVEGSASAQVKVEAWHGPLLSAHYVVRSVCCPLSMLSAQYVVRSVCCPLRISKNQRVGAEGGAAHAKAACWCARGAPCSSCR